MVRAVTEPVLPSQRSNGAALRVSPKGRFATLVASESLVILVNLTPKLLPKSRPVWPSVSWSPSLAQSMALFIPG